MTNEIIRPGATIGILGGGQLGRMSAMAAYELGYKVAVWAPGESGIPAGEIATHWVKKEFDDEVALQEFYDLANVVTTEWENIPVELLEKLRARDAIVCPSSGVLHVAQNRIEEKRLAQRLRVPTTNFCWLPKDGTWEEGWHLCLPGILKTNRDGYDGKGQWRVSNEDELREAHAEAKADCVLEKMVDLHTEISVLVARNARGEIQVSDCVENTHQDGILDTSFWPTRKIDTGEELQIEEIAVEFAAALRLEGVLCLEFFIDTDHEILFNEMAPRPHNSFHGSIEAARTSQFRQHILAICNQDLGKVSFHTEGTMRNLIGDTKRWEERHAIDPKVDSLHLYGKPEVRPGRKMGHVTSLEI